MLAQSSGLHNVHCLEQYATRPTPSRSPVLQRQRSGVVPRALSPADVTDAVSGLGDVLTLALTPIGTPCVIQNCGDQIYRSTLDPSLYKRGGFDWRGALLLATAAGYLFLPPGVLPGFIDTYFLSRVKKSNPVDKANITLGKKLGTGGFGTVFKADLKLENGDKVPIIVKKAKEFGEAEVWMNERMSRVGGNHVAEFITAFDDRNATVKPSRGGSPLDESIWLLWYYEGDNTLSGLMEKKEFPYNLEPLLFGRELRLPKGALRKQATIKVAFKQLLEAVAACHSTGIVHRDIKPQNCILSARDQKLKLIDMGAAADLRVGINYVPKEYLLDPRYAPPQQYIMSTQTPKPPPAPVAAFLSPVLWAMEKPDRFDMFSCGVALMQLAFPALRNDDRLLTFRAKLQEIRWDMDAWRRLKESELPEMKQSSAEEWREGFEVLDVGGGWEVVKGLMAYEPTQRWSAARALGHPWLGGSSVSTSLAARAGSLSDRVLSSAGRGLEAIAGKELLDEALYKTGSGAFTEAQLMQELGLEEAAPVAPETRQTIAWWQERQNDLNKRKGSTSTEVPEGAKGTAAGTKQTGGSAKLNLKVPVVAGVAAKSPKASAPKQAAAGSSDSSSGKFNLRGLFKRSPPS